MPVASHHITSPIQLSACMLDGIKKTKFLKHISILLFNVFFSIPQRRNSLNTFCTFARPSHIQDYRMNLIVWNFDLLIPLPLIPPPPQLVVLSPLSQRISRIFTLLLLLPYANDVCENIIKSNQVQYKQNTLFLCLCYSVILFVQSPQTKGRLYRRRFWILCTLCSWISLHYVRK